MACRFVRKVLREKIEIGQIVKAYEHKAFSALIFVNICRLKNAAYFGAQVWCWSKVKKLKIVGK